MFIRVSGRCEGSAHPIHLGVHSCVRAYVEIRDYKYVFMILHYYIFIFDAIIFDNQIMASAPTHSSPGGISGSI